MVLDLWTDRLVVAQNRDRPQKALRILFLEESDDFASDIAREVRHGKPWTITHIKDPAEALQIAQISPIDVALLSATMQDTDPIDVAEQLTALHPKLTTFIL